MIFPNTEAQPAAEVISMVGQGEAENANRLVPKFTYEEFSSSDKPYAWLYEQKGNPFLQQQMLQQINADAKALKYTGFLGTWKKYLEVREPKQQLLGDFVTDFPDQPMQLHCGKYFADEFGIAYKGRKGEEIEVCSHPIMPVKRLIDVETHKEQIEIAFKRGNGKWRTVIKQKTDIANRQKIVDLAGDGIAVNSETAGYLVKYLTDIESINYDVIPIEYAVYHLGWINGQFVPYTDFQYYGENAQFNKIYNAIRPSGNDLEDGLKRWAEAFSYMRNNGQRFLPLRIVMAASFASVLIQPTGKLPFWTHLHSVMAGTGKTTGLMGSASVWGNPDREAGLIQSMKITDNALEFRNSFLHDLPCILDELQVVQDREGYSDYIYQHCEGIGKGRGTRKATLQQQKTWSNCVISSGEMPIIQDTDHAGSLLRVIDVPTNNTVVDNPKEFLRIIRSNYGYAGKVFVGYVSKNLEKIKDSVEKTAQRLMDGYGIASKQADTGALLIVADKIADGIIFHDGNALTTKELAPFLKTNKQIDMNSRILEQVRDWLVQHQTNFITDTTMEQPPRDIWGKITMEDGQTHWLVISSVLGKELSSRKYNTSAFVNWCVENRYIVSYKSSGDNRIQKKVYICKGYSRCYDFVFPSEGDSKEDYIPVNDDDLPF